MLKRTAFALLTLLSCLPLAPVPVSASAPRVTPDPSYVCSDDFRDYLRPHPIQTAYLCFPGTGWGRIVYTPAGAEKNVLVPFVTPTYTTSTSEEYICMAEELFARPVSPRTEGNIPSSYTRQDRVMTSGCDPTTGLRDSSRVRSVKVVLPPQASRDVENICVAMEQSTGVITRIYDNPCYHFNKWEYGPRNGISACDRRKNCETVGHSAQKGYQRFLAHYEVWQDVAQVAPPPGFNFEPCGDLCNPPSCDPDTDPECQPVCDPNTDPECQPVCDPSTDPACRPACDPLKDPTCLPTCEAADDTGCVPPPPPPFCDSFPDDPRCKSAIPTGTRFEVTVTIPDRYSAKGTILSEGATVTAVELRCSERACTPSLSNADPIADKVTGGLVLEASATYRRCTTPRSGSCGFYQDVTDRSSDLVVGDRVAANFFSPTRASETVIIRTNGIVGRVRSYALVPVYELVSARCRPVDDGCGLDGYRYVWNLTDRVERRETGTIEVPVVIKNQYGELMPAGGFRRTVIGTVGD